MPVMNIDEELTAGESAADAADAHIQATVAQLGHAASTDIAQLAQSHLVPLDESSRNGWTSPAVESSPQAKGVRAPASPEAKDADDLVQELFQFQRKAV